MTTSSDAINIATTATVITTITDRHHLRRAEVTDRLHRRRDVTDHHLRRAEVTDRRLRRRDVTDHRLHHAEVTDRRLRRRDVTDHRRVKVTNRPNRRAGKHHQRKQKSLLQSEEVFFVRKIFQPVNFLKATQALCPPKPNEFDMAALTVRDCAAFGT